MTAKWEKRVLKTPGAEGRVAEIEDELTKTWTLGPDYPIVRCRRCGASLEPKDIKSGFCWVCGDMGAVEFTRGEFDDWAK